MAGAIAVKRAKHALLLNHFSQRCQHRRGRFLLDQLRVIDLTSSVVHDHQQVVPAIVAEPAMLTSIDVQQHPGQWSSWPPLPMFAALASGLYQTRALQR